MDRECDKKLYLHLRKEHRIKNFIICYLFSRFFKICVILYLCKNLSMGGCMYVYRYVLVFLYYMFEKYYDGGH